MAARRKAPAARDTEAPAAGLYDLVLSELLAERLRLAGTSLRIEQSQLDPAEAPRRLAAHFAELLEHALTVLHEKKLLPVTQAELCNRLIVVLAGQMRDHGVAEQVDARDLLSPKLLLEIATPDLIVAQGASLRPSLPLSETHLLVNARGEHSIGSELEREIASADSIDMLCSFLLWSGYIRLRPRLTEFLKRKGTRLRVITTVYMGATEARVLDDLHKAGAQLRVSYDTRQTRLHAKAWLLHRSTGFTTAYIGSSNLSASAMTDGLEWNVRVGRNSPDVLNKFEAAFEGYWNDEAFEPYDPQRDGQRLRNALTVAGSRSQASSLLLDVRPYPYQQAILERLESERFEFGRMRNLVVAATGTGKTVIAGLDFKSMSTRFRSEHGRTPSLLFIAHRAEILEQARGTFRSVLGNADFGDLLVGGNRPTTTSALFASVQSLASLEPSEIEPSRWDIVIVDEFHHAAAPTYRRWLDHLSPWILLGLTATPERADGEDILRWFGGQSSSDLRLWDAIDQGLLVPFQYFGLKDSLDTSSYWKRNRLDIAELDNVLSAHDVRARQVLDAVREHVSEPSQMRALGFCVGRHHAQFMANYFRDHGLAAETALGDDGEERRDRISQLRQGKLQALFTVDALTEGVDIRELDTVLMLRPTESATVFLQQLGRGLRHADGKRCLTVLDLVSNPSREFRMDLPLRALIGGTRVEVAKEVETGFPSLPPGCSIQLTDDAKDIVLENLKNRLSSQSSKLVSELRRLGPETSLAKFLVETGLSLTEVIRDGRSMTSLRRLAGFELAPGTPIEVAVAKGISRLTTLDDRDVLSALSGALASETADLAILKPALVQLLGWEPYGDPQLFLSQIVSHGPALRELKELVEVLWGLGAYPSHLWTIGDARLRVHCHYTMAFICAALAPNRAKPISPPWGVGIWTAQEINSDALFITTNKAEKRYSPSTMYHDYAISKDLFHWQSQSTSTTSGKRGQRHVNHRELGVTPLLFVRAHAEAEHGTSPYLFLGPATCVEYHGERPINITWKLEYPMPAEAYEEFRVAR